MDELQARISELEAKAYKLEEEQTNIRLELESTKTRLLEESMKTLGDSKTKYEAKLERIKDYVDVFLKTTHTSPSNIKYGFRKRDMYADDFYESMPDPLDFSIAEYNLLGIDMYCEIRFDYHHESVKEFVTEWMTRHMTARYEDDLYGFRD